MKDFGGVNHAGNHAGLTEKIVAGQVLSILSPEEKGFTLRSFIQCLESGVLRGVVFLIDFGGTLQCVADAHAGDA